MTKQTRITVDNLLVDTIVGLYIAVGRWLSRWIRYAKPRLQVLRNDNTSKTALEISIHVARTCTKLFLFVSCFMIWHFTYAKIAYSRIGFKVRVPQPPALSRNKYPTTDEL